MVGRVLLLLAGCGRIGFAPTTTDADGDGRLPDATSRYNTVFATSTTLAFGSLGGIGPADDLCASAAASAGLGGTYVAWLSTPTVDAIDRLAGARGWVRRDGRPFADTPADIEQGRIYYPVRYDEHGVDLGPADAITGTGGTGRHLASCNGWTTTIGSATMGNSYGTTGNFSDQIGFTCAGTSSVYCFGISLVEPLVVTTTTGRTAFVSTTPWAIAGGVTAADAHCQSDATAAGLSGTYRALLATTTQTAASRFDIGGAPWVRRDGVALGPTASASLRATETSLHVDALGQFLDVQVWTGADGVDMLATPQTCSDWTDPGGAAGGKLVQASSTINLMQNAGNGAAATSCGQARHLYCFEL